MSYASSCISTLQKDLYNGFILTYTHRIIKVEKDLQDHQVHLLSHHHHAY